jgi:hypothetical protein
MAYGPGSDLFGFAAAGIELQSTSISPQGSEAQAADENGDIQESTVYGAWSTASQTYKVGGGTTATLPNIGSKPTAHYITKIEVKRSNNDVLTITIEGVSEAFVTSTPKEYDVGAVMPTGYLVGGKGAVLAGITLSAGKVISSSISCGVSLTPPMLSAAGAVVDMDIFGGRMDATNECQSATVITPAADTGWALAPGTGSAADSNTSYSTQTVTAFRNVLGV